MERRSNRWNEPQQDGLAILLGQFVDDLIQDGCEVFKIVIGTVQRIHFSSLPFPQLSAPLTARGVARHEAGMAMEPTTQHHRPGQFRRLARQVQEHGLRDILRAVGIAIDKSKGGGIDQVDVAPNQLAERGLGAGGGVIDQELTAIGHDQSLLKTRGREKSATKKRTGEKEKAAKASEGGKAEKGTLFRADGR